MSLENNFVVQKQKVDQEKEIENEIQRELERSRIRRTESKADKEKRNVITHHPRYVESTREHEKDFIDPYYRGATYDVVNRNINQYPEVDDSYIIQNKPERVERYTERNFNPGVTELDIRTKPRSPLRKSTVNPQYKDEYNISVGDQRYRDDAGSTRNRPQSQYRRDSDIEYNDSEVDNRGKSYGSSQNLKQAILDKKMKEERDNRRYDDF
jgi:hypothetical protein